VNENPFEAMNKFEARNELERKLEALHDGLLSETDFLGQLVDTEIFMPIQDDTTAQGIQRSTSAKPLVVEDESGTPVMLLFTSPERAKPVVREFPGFGGGLLTEFKWVLEKLDDGVGVSINPTLEIGYDIEPASVKQLQAGLKKI
jgi:hypothetical protein